MYYIEPFLALLCLCSMLALLVIWRVLSATHDEALRKQAKLHARRRNQLNTADFVIKSDSLESDANRVHAFSGVTCNFHCIDEELWSESSEDAA